MGNESPLSQMSPLPQMAGGGNPLVENMLQTLMINSGKRQDYLEQQRQAYQTQMNRYAEMVAQSQQERAHDAQRWGSMAEAAASVSPEVGNLGAMLGKVGGAYGKSREYELQSNLRTQGDLTKLQQSELRALENSSYNNALLKATTARGVTGFEFRRNSDGTTTAFSKATGLPVGTYGPQDIKQISSLAQVLAKEALDKGEYSTLDEALGWATSAAMEQVSRMQGSVGNRTKPLQGDIGGLPTTPQPLELSPADKELAQRLVNRMNANPENEVLRNNTLRQLNEILKRYPADEGGAVINGESSVPVMAKKDVAVKEADIASGKETGKDRAGEYKTLRTAGMAAGDLVTQLNLLTGLLEDPNIPEGALGSHLQKFRSGLKTLGIEVGPEVGAGDLVGSISGKLALLTRTADGNNLMPGAMSNFEQEILRSLVPNLEGTREGRAQLAKFLSEMAKSRMRFSEEAVKMAGKRGILPPEWDQRALRISKEEMLRLNNINRGILQNFKGKQ